MTKSILLISLQIFAMTFFANSQNSDSLQISTVIKNSYIEGLINAKNFTEAKKGIHGSFEILGHMGDSLTEKSINQWITQRKKRSNLAEVKYKICFIDIEEDAAVSKIEMFRGNIRAVDYVFLYQFDTGWKIVSAIDNVKAISKIKY